jgi:protein arginine kinase activator
MLCDECKEREGVVSVTKMQNNSMTLENLCEKCAAARGIETTVAMPKHPLSDFLSGVQQQLGNQQADAARCSFCQTTLREFRNSGRLGCMHCYATFEQSLRELLRKIHGNSQHAGRRYEPPAPTLMERSSTLGELRDRLRRAVETEQFELAASIRDQIKGLE